MSGATIGELLEFTETWHRHRCWTCEDEIREQPGVPVDVWKVAARTAIPAGRYRVTIRHSHRFQRPMPYIENVPGFSGILIHPGNTAADTAGCLLVGRTTNGVEIFQSIAAFKDLFQRIAADLADEHEVFLTIVNPPAEEPLNV